VKRASLTVWESQNVPCVGEDGEGAVATFGAFDGLGMLQQNKGCSSLCGPVAQLGARFHGMEEVTGSIPVRSTNQIKHLAPPVFRGAILDKAMTCDSHLFQLWAQYPGLRVGRAWSGFETMFTTVLGQLVSVSFGRILIDELMRAAGSKAHHPKTREDIYLFPTAQQIIDADLSRVRTSEGRRTTIRAMATLVENGSLNWGKAGSTGQLRATLLAIPGWAIGQQST
jgi:hypothetical protein